MQPQVPTAGKLLVMGAFALCCFGLLLFLWLAFGGAIPFQSKGYRVTIPFKETGQLAQESDVRISGFTVGKVKSITFDRGNAESDVQVEIEAKYAPLAKDTFAILRQKTLLGETYVEITPGNPNAGERDSIPEGGRLASSQVDQSVQLDEIYRQFDPRTRAAFQVWMQRLATVGDGRGRDISSALGNLPAFTESATTLTRILNEQQPAVQRLVRNTGVVFEALTERGDALRGLIENGNRVFATTAERDQQLADTFRALPTFERESAETLERLNAFVRDADPLVTQLRPAAVQLGPTMDALRGLAPDLRAFFVDLNPFISAAKRGLPAVDDFLDELVPVLGQIDPFLRNLEPIIEGLGFYQRELSAFFSSTTAATQATNTPAGAPPETRLHYLRTTNPVNPEILTQYPFRIGTNRPNPYVFPGAFANLASGLQSFETRGCTNPVPQPVANSLLPPVLQSIMPASLQNLVRQIVYGGQANPAAPPCTQQGPFPSLGQGSTTSSDYPHLFEAPQP